MTTTPDVVSAGSIQVPVEIRGEIMPGVVAVPHGWGHDRSGVGWRIAAARPGASVNVIPVTMDPLSGNAFRPGAPVRVSQVVDQPVAPRLRDGQTVATTPAAAEAASILKSAGRH